MLIVESQRGKLRNGFVFCSALAPQNDAQRVTVAPLWAVNSAIQNALKEIAMGSTQKKQTIGAICGLLVLAGCAAPQDVQKSAPRTAMECRQEIYENPHERGAVIASGGGLSIGASIAIAVTSAALTSSVAANAEAKQLKSCYDTVGAAPEDRLPLTAATKRRDDIVMAGGTPPKVVTVQPERSGPGGGAGFSSF